MKNQVPQPITEKTFIKRMIPQEDPFVMVDSLFYCDETKAVSGLLVSEENMLSTETCLSEAGLIENMAQSVALHGGYSAFINGEGGKPEKGFLGAIKTLEIFELPPINTRVQTTIVVNHDIMGVKLSEISVKNEEGKIVATAIMKTATITT